jgi:UDP-N-acetylglucosamine:LPS N-acetylglucosamine transferase
VLWSFIYAVTSRKGDPNLVVRPLLAAGVREVVERERPGVVLSVLPAINGLLSQSSPNVEVVLTDWNAVHRYWVAPGVRRYTASTDAARADLIRFGAAPGHIDVVGIPVRRQFATPPSSRDHTGRLKIVAMVGAEGSPRALRNLAALAQADLDAELTIVCGRNRALRRTVESLRSRVPVTALGFIEDVAQLMKSADLLVTKAGGVTLAEAFCCQVPVIVHDVVPGQESGNVEYVLRHGAAAYAPSPRALVETVTALAREPRQRQQLAQSGARLARPDAAAQIAENVLRRL